MKKIGIIALLLVVIITVLYFGVDKKPIKYIDISHASVNYIDNCINLNDEQIGDLNAILTDMTAKRRFAPSNITEDESTLMVNITTNDGAKHIIFNDEGYLYSSADDAIWYRIDNADQLRSYIEILLIAEY